jgi:hypothetical protein
MTVDGGMGEEHFITIPDEQEKEEKEEEYRDSVVVSRSVLEENTGTLQVCIV